MPDKKVLWLTMQKQSNQINQSINQSSPTRKTQNVPWDKQQKAKHSYVLCSENGLNHNPNPNKESN